MSNDTQRSYTAEALQVLVTAVRFERQSRRVMDDVRRLHDPAHPVYQRAQHGLASAEELTAVALQLSQHALAHQETPHDGQ